MSFDEYPSWYICPLGHGSGVSIKKTIYEMDMTHNVPSIRFRLTQTRRVGHSSKWVTKYALCALDVCEAPTFMRSVD
jgi:hypothetical protein